MSSIEFLTMIKYFFGIKENVILMTMFLVLIGLSVVGAILAFLLPMSKKGVVVALTSLLIAIGSVVVCAMFFAGGNAGNLQVLGRTNHAIDYTCFAINMVLCVVIIAFSIRYKKPIPIILAILQIGLEIYLEFFSAKTTLVSNSSFAVDTLSIVMVAIIGIVGSGICVYAIGYMSDFASHQKEDEKDRRGLFFFLCIIFLGAMFLIVCSNNMTIMFCGWEITTVCSFLLIGYTKTDEAIRNSFLQITYNMIGGIAFAVAMIICANSMNTIELSGFVGLATSNDKSLIAGLVCALLSLAALTKAAQVPFHTWLLGAMVAPTPTSALLHSSTMVKAGVFLLIKIAPALYSFQVCGVLVSLIGGVTFLSASAFAISQSNGKRVLAYSTIANLGLIVICAGIATESSIWAAIMLLIFHAIAKSLLFLCVGTAEHHVGSRDIESFDLLFSKMPKLARFMMLGILVMFIAPFGMLVAKWSVIVSLSAAKNVALLVFLAFGSAMTFMYWAKWLGKLSAISANAKNVETTVTKSENFALYLMATLLVIANFLLPVLSQAVVIPEISSLASASSDILSPISAESLIFCGVVTLLIVIVLFVGINRPKSQDTRQLTPYLAGITAKSEDREFVSSTGENMPATTRNMYLENLFGESYTSIVQIFAWLIIAMNIGYYLFVSGIF